MQNQTTQADTDPADSRKNLQSLRDQLPESESKPMKKDIRKAALKKEAEKFKQFLSLSGISQTQAAELCYLTPRAIAYYLSGERPVPRWLPEFIVLKLANPREVLP